MLCNNAKVVNPVSQSTLFDEAYYIESYPDVPLSGLSAAEHYLHIGARLGRNPSPGFDSTAYLETYLDVAARGENPLLHYEMYGKGEGRDPRPSPSRRKAADQVETSNRVDVVVPVYNALEDVKACLASLADCETNYDLRVLVINDGSDAETTGWLREACSGPQRGRARFELIEHDRNKGYTKAVNTGLRASDAPYVVTLNSDTIVTPFWLDGLVRCLDSAPEIGIAGPLSNAASWQNVPSLMSPEGGFAVNTLPDGLGPDDMAAIVQRTSRRSYPRTTFVNGFCFMIRREVIDAIGFMDEDAFPTGYGEENDFCIRAQDAGFALAYADDTYVFHAKSKSFGNERRAELSRAGSEAIRRKHGKEKFEALLEDVKNTQQMDVVRTRISRELPGAGSNDRPRAVDFVVDQKILFLLPVRGGGGGAHSVVQEAAAMRAMGLKVKIAVHDADFFNFMHLYNDIPGANELFIGFREETVVATVQPYDVVVATIYSSIRLIERVLKSCPWILPVYYAQDYEPLFFEEGSENWVEAFVSYTRLPEAVIVAKTDWICREIEKNHGVTVQKIDPSIDHSVYFPAPARPAEKGTVRIAAMIRPSTPRRGAGRTMELLARLQNARGNTVRINIFGCDDGDSGFHDLRRDFEFRNHGILTRPQVADLLRETDIFVDLSDYQAFGRTGLEAMACGATAVVPVAGGGDEYAVDNINALVVDSFDLDTCFSRLVDLMDTPARLDQMRMAALRTASRYSPRRAAMSELATFATALAAHRETKTQPARPKVALMPALTSSHPITITGSGYVRLLSTYRQDAIARHWETTVLNDGALPEPGSADVLVLQRDIPASARDGFDDWHARWRQSGGRLVYEIDDDLTDAAALIERGYPGDANALADQVHKFAKAADVISVSTHHLASVLSEYAAKIHVVPNFVDAGLWDLGPIEKQESPAATPLKIGYFGTPTHTEDLMIVREAIRDIETRSDVAVEVVGAFQRIDPLFGKRIDLPRNSVYPVFVDWLQQIARWDICIIPLADNSFNRSKSNLKFVESAALGTAIICSDTPEYSYVARDEENCLLVSNNRESWAAALHRLVEDTSLRQRLANNALDDARSKWTVQGNADLYDAVLSAALGGGLT